MSISLMNLTKDEKFQMILILAIIIVVCAILHFIKIKFRDKIDKSESKFIKRFFKDL